MNPTDFELLYINGMNISVEQILAAIIHTVGTVNIKIEDLISNYSDKSIAVNQLEDKSVTFSCIFFNINDQVNSKNSLAKLLGNSLMSK